jgi:hypothetical protein
MYQCAVHFILTDDLAKEYNRIYRKHKELPIYAAEDGEAWTLTFDISDYYILVSEKHKFVNTIAHEVYHVVYSILNDRDIDDEENGAWLCGMLMEEALKFYKNGIHRPVRKVEGDAGRARQDGSDHARLHKPNDN